MNSDSIRVIAIVVAALILVGLIYYYYINVPKPTQEKFTHDDTVVYDPVIPEANGSRQYSSGTNRVSPSLSCPKSSGSACGFEPMPVEPSSNEYHLPPPPTTQSSPYYANAKNKAASFPQDRIKPEDLLPKDAANTKWAQANPAGQGDVNDVNLLNAGFHIGVNTQGQSLKNASYDLRSEPSNPRYKISIWNNSTIEPDMNRKPLE